MNERKYWLGFSLIPEIGPKRIVQLLNAFGSLESAWNASETQIRRAGLDKNPTNNLLKWRGKLQLDNELSKLERLGVSLLTLVDDAYPSGLKQLSDPPPVLYVRGTLTPADTRALAVVGTRKATTYGRDAAYSLSYQLAQQGITIISGLAHGIDAAAHRAALDAGGRTLAVMGSGIDRLYPADHQKLAQEIARQGALITEFPLGTAPEKNNFPRRNRLISGLSLGVLIVEAPEHSGALITAEIASNQGRDVFAVPGSIFNPMSSGTNRLIQDGAKLIMNVKDVLDELDMTYQHIETRNTAERLAPTDETEARLLSFLGREPVHVDEIVRQCGLPVATVTSTLTLLELKGLARSAGHMQYCLPL